ncbi:Claspin [Amphibalanus amphitrite]|uniref:Claspin n=1 Tax=Amphibalanus amphitrite TaxID=1232801 RepID=A0A6A4VCP5_AMPAM|nr:Claspin [Amphibalanus amphitrite]
MAAAVVESSIQESIANTPAAHMAASQSEPEQLNASGTVATQSTVESQSAEKSSQECSQAADTPSKDHVSAESQEPAAASDDDTQPESSPQQQADGGRASDSDSDGEPVRRPRARRLAVDSDDEPSDPAPPPADHGESDGEAETARKAPARGRVRRPVLDSEEEDGPGSGRDGAAEKGAGPPAEGGAAAGDSEDEERERKEKNMRRLMALADSSSEDERHRPDTPASPTEAAEQMRQIRSAAQRRTRESRLNLPYHRPRQRTLHEFLARRQKAPALPDHPRLAADEADYITKKLQEKEKEIEQFYKSESEKGDDSDPDWKPDGAAAAADSSQPPAARAAAAAPAPTPAPAPEAREEEDEDRVLSQSSQKVQEWLEGVQPAGEGAHTPPMSDETPETHTETERTAPGPETEPRDTEMETETGTAAGTESTAATGAAADTGPAEAAAGSAGERGETETEPPAEERPAETEESRSVSADTETTSLAPGDSASEVNARAAAAAATTAGVPASSATPAATSAAAPSTSAVAGSAGRLARLAARLPQLGAVLGATPRLQRRGEVVSLDDSDEERGAPEPTELDRFVERFVRHSNAKPKKAEKKTVNISLVRFESDAAGGQQLVADSVPVTVSSGDRAEPSDGPPGAQRQQLRRALRDTIRRQREEARQRRERQYKLYNSEQVDDGYLDDLPDEEAELSDVSSDSGESEPEEEPPLTETPRKRCPLVDDEAEQDEEEDGDGDGDGEEGDKEEKGGDDELKLVLEDDDEDLLGSPPRRASVTTEPELFSTQPSGAHADSASQADSQDSDRASSSLVTAHQPGGGFRFGGTRAAADGPGQETAGLTPALDSQPTGGQPDTQPVDGEPDTQPTDGTGSFSVPPADDWDELPAGAADDLPDSLSQLGPLRLSPEPRGAAGRGPRSAIGALIDPAADDTMDDLMSLCSGKFDAAPVSGRPTKVTRADTQPVDLLSVPAPTNKDGVWTAGAASKKGSDRGPSSEPLPGMSLMSAVDIHSPCVSEAMSEAPFLCVRMSLMSAVDMFEDGNANMPLDIVSDDEDASSTQLVRQKKRRRRLVFSDDEGSGGDEPFEHDAAGSEDEDGEDSGEDSVQAARAEDSSLPTDFTGFLGGDRKKVRSEFFEAEAELSGSDEPSEDEEDGDELDRMDEEEADGELIDERKLRLEVERIHQKKALDEDIREMKLFQERFLEDGDLHGKGRERKFRWSNADDAGDDSNERRPSDDEADPGEEERDEKWRMERHEREKWLQEHGQKGPEEDEEPQSGGFTFIKPGQRVLRRLQKPAESAPAAPAPAAATRPAGQPPPLPSSPRAVKLVSRGSFLRRGKEALARLVTTARSMSLPAGSSSKNSSNRTFSMGKRQQSESEPDPEVEEQFQQTVEEKTTKRKTPSTPATDPKRAKLSRSFSSLAEDSQSSSLFSIIL